MTEKKKNLRRRLLIRLFIITSNPITLRYD